MLIHLIIYLSCGAVIGFLAGLLGIGGGVMGIPVLLSIFKLQGLSPDTSMRMAVGTSLAIVALTGMSSAWSHYKRGAILFSLFKRFTPGAVIGSILGILIATHLHGELLREVFAVFLFLVATQMIFKKHDKTQSVDMANVQLPHGLKLLGSSVFFGTLSGMLGIGGGAFMVPYFTWCGVPIRNAVATATVCLLPVALVGAIGYMLLGDTTSGLPHFSLGFVYLPAFLGMGIASIFLAPCGARLAHSVSGKVLNRIFAVFLFVIGMKMLIG